jgi:hypothetical protein
MSMELFVREHIRYERTGTPAHLQYAPRGQYLYGLAQSCPGHAEVIRKLGLVGNLLPRTELGLLDNQLFKLGSRSLREISAFSGMFSAPSVSSCSDGRIITDSAAGYFVKKCSKFYPLFLCKTEIVKNSVDIRRIMC